VVCIIVVPLVCNHYKVRKFANFFPNRKFYEKFVTLSLVNNGSTLQSFTLLQSFALGYNCHTKHYLCGCLKLANFSPNILSTSVFSYISDNISDYFARKRWIYLTSGPTVLCPRLQMSHKTLFMQLFKFRKLFPKHTVYKCFLIHFR